MAEYKFDFCVNTDGRLHVTQLPKTLFPITRNGHTFTLKTGVSPNQIPVYLTYKDGSLFRAHCSPEKVDAMFGPLPEGTKLFKYSKNETLTRP